MRAALLKAYRKTCYEVAGIAVLIGRRSVAMDRLLQSRAAREAVFITAYNPFSRGMPAGWNQRMQVSLARALRQRQLLVAKGTWRRWSEEHIVVFGDARPAYRLARRFRQNSVVLVRLRRPAQLMTTSRP
jgi:hypothetical protein